MLELNVATLGIDKSWEFSCQKTQVQKLKFYNLKKI